MNTVSDDCETIDVLASDFLARYRDGERPTVDEYARRHPEYADAIRRMFPLVASIERIKIDEQVRDDGRATLAGRVVTQLGDFRIVREIGRGGMGIVFEAHQESLDRVVAIKVLPKQSLLDNESLQRFRTEATTAAAMHHANIVPIYGTGESEGSHYMVMQLVDGESLDAVIASGSQLPYRDAARVGQQVADAIAYSHANGVLHRDIKPGNILIEEDGTAQVTDFGLAKHVNADLTSSRSASGSLRYMAPERFAGISDERSDIYAIGLTLYELLAGRPAFEKLDPEHLIGSIGRPSIKPLVQIRSDVPVDLCTIISKAINVEPSHRYQSADALRDDLGRFLAGEPIQARKISALKRLRLWSRRNPKLAAASGIAFIALLTATVTSTVAYAMTSAANQRSAEALQTAEQTVDLALNSLDGVVDAVSQTRTSTNIAVGDSFDIGEALPDVDMEPSPGSAKILEELQPLYERLSRQSPSRPDIILQNVDASIQLARIQHLLGRTSDSIETLDASIRMLNDRGRYVSIPMNDRQLRFARLNNELGVMHAAEFHRDESARHFESAIQAASLMNDGHVAGQIELARSYLNVGSRPRQLRRGETLSKEQREADLENIASAIRVLLAIDDQGQHAVTSSILHARSLMARSRLAETPHDKRVDSNNAASILRKQLSITPDDSNVRFELVESLADINMRGQRSQARTADASRRLYEALKENDILRSRNPENALFLSSDVHLRHKLSAIARAQSRFADADAMLRDAIELQTSLVQTWPDSVRHRCWRAILYRSQATLYRQWGKLDASKESITNAKDDVDSIDAEFIDHPLVSRTRTTIGEFANEN